MTVREPNLFDPDLYDEEYTRWGAQLKFSFREIETDFVEPCMRT